MRALILALSLMASAGALAQTVVLPAPVNYPAQSSGSVTASATIVAVPGAKVTKICNTTASPGGNLWVNPSGNTATSSAGDEAAAGGGCVTYTGPVTNLNGNAITAVCDSGTCTYAVTVGN